MKIYERESSNLLVRSKLPGADWVINPYVGCTHRCKYCYAVFMRRFCKCEEKWGDFLIVKKGSLSGLSRVKEGDVVLIGSVTDAYQPVEKHYERTRAILEEMKKCRGKIEILTKSKLVLRDIELLKQLRDVRIGISLNTLDDSFRRFMEPGASSVAERIETLKKLKERGMATYLFISPIYPGITDLEEIIKAVGEYADVFCFENLNLRGDYKAHIMRYIHESFSDYEELYKKIYDGKNMDYWEECKMDIERLAEKYDIKTVVYFYHNKIRKQ